MLGLAQTVFILENAGRLGDTGKMVQMSTETLVTVLTGLGLLVAMIAAMSSFFFSLRKEMKDGQESLRSEMRDVQESLRSEMRNGQESLRGEMQTGMASLRSEMQVGQEALRREMQANYRSLNERLDGTNMRIDRLVDSLREPSSA